MATGREDAEAALVAIYRSYGEAAVYTPPVGAAVSCSVIIDRQDRAASGEFGRQVHKGTVIEVRQSEVAAPVRTGTFVVGAETFTIVDDPCTPDDDEDRLLWRMTAKL